MLDGRLGCFTLYVPEALPCLAFPSRQVPERVGQQVLDFLELALPPFLLTFGKRIECLRIENVTVFQGGKGETHWGLDYGNVAFASFLSKLLEHIFLAIRERILEGLFPRLKFRFLKCGGHGSNQVDKEFTHLIPKLRGASRRQTKRPGFVRHFKIEHISPIIRTFTSSRSILKQRFRCGRCIGPRGRGDKKIKSFRRHSRGKLNRLSRAVLAKKPIKLDSR